MSNRIIGLVVAVIVLLLIAYSMYLGWVSTTYTEMESWGFDYGPGWQTGINVIDKETALQAFVKYYSQSENFYVKDASKNLTTEDVYFGVIKNVNTQGFENRVPELNVWKLNNSILYNKAVDENGTIYTGGILSNSFASELKRAT